MSYNKKIWANGDLITKEGMNNIEYGIYDAHDKINTINDKVEENTTDTNTAKQDISDIKLQIGTEELTTNAKKVKGAINEVNSQIKEKANKDEVFTMANMGQDIREAMTGGSVAVVGNNCVGLGQFIPSIQEDIGVWNNQEFTLENKAYNTTTGALDSSKDSRIWSFSINATSGDKFKIHGFTFGPPDCLIMFLNSNDALISTIGKDLTWGTPETFEFTCPVGTSKVRMNTWASNDDKTIEKFVYSPIATKEDIAILDNITENDISILDNIKNQLETYETIEYDETTYGYAVKSNKPYLYTNGGAGNSSTIITVTKSDIYIE